MHDPVALKGGRQVKGKLDTESTCDQTHDMILLPENVSSDVSGTCKDIHS